MDRESAFYLPTPSLRWTIIKGLKSLSTWEVKRQWSIVLIFIVSGTEKIWEVYNLYVLFIFLCEVFCLCPSSIWILPLPHGASPVAQSVKNLPALRESWVQSLGWEDALEEEMATHSSALAWRAHEQRSWVGSRSRGCESQTRLSNKTTVSSKILAPQALGHHTQGLLLWHDPPDFWHRPFIQLHLVPRVLVPRALVSRWEGALVADLDTLTLKS